MKIKKGILTVRNSRKVYIPIYAMILIILGTVLYIQFSGRQLNPIALYSVAAFCAVGVLGTEYHRLRNSFQVNETFIVYVHGVFFKTTKKTDLLVISDLEVKQNPWQQLLHYGTVNAMVFSKDSMTSFKNINNPMEIVDFIQMKMENLKTIHKPH